MALSHKVNVLSGVAGPATSPIWHTLMMLLASLQRQTHRMPSSAPRYDPRLLVAIRELDDAQQPMAETCRRVGDAADRLGLTRPSYVHLRRIIKAERELNDQLDEIKRDVLRDLLSGRVPRLDRVLDDVREAKGRAELRRRS